MTLYNATYADFVDNEESFKQAIADMNGNLTADNIDIKSVTDLTGARRRRLAESFSTLEVNYTITVVVDDLVGGYNDDDVNARALSYFAAISNSIAKGITSGAWTTSFRAHAVDAGSTAFTTTTVVKYSSDSSPKITTVSSPAPSDDDTTGTTDDSASDDAATPQSDDNSSAQTRRYAIGFGVVGGFLILFAVIFAIRATHKKKGPESVTEIQMKQIEI